MSDTEHDINFSVYDNNVAVNIQTDLPQDYTDNTTRQDKMCKFVLECNSNVEAELLYRYLRDRHSKAIKMIRMKEFFSGWKQAIAKKRGKKWFNYFGNTLANKETHENL